MLSAHLLYPDTLPHGYLCRIVPESSPHGRAAIPSQSSIYFTLGGFIIVDGKLYGMTTAHQLYVLTAKANAGQKASMLGLTDSDPDSRMPVTFPICGTIGQLSVYNWGSVRALRQPSSSALLATDWALIEVQRDKIEEFGLEAIMQTYKNEISGFAKKFEPTVGLKDVWICSGRSQPQKGKLNTSITTILLGDSLFEVHSVELGHPLGNELQPLFHLTGNTNAE
jgi:hypothetical protein